MTEVLREVRLYGELGRRFGRRHRLAIRTPHEAVRALVATVDGFGRFLLERADLGYRVFVDRAACALEQLHAPIARSEVVKIVPVVGGAKRGGLGLLLAGVLLFYGAPFAGGLMSGTVSGGLVASYGMKIGVALMLGGVMQLLSPQRKGGSATPTQNEPSYAFGGAANPTQQGVAVPLVYGRVITGGPEISGGLLAEEIAAPVAPSPPAPEPLPDWQNYYVLDHPESP